MPGILFRGRPNVSPRPGIPPWPCLSIPSNFSTWKRKTLYFLFLLPDVLSLPSKCCLSQGPAYYKTSCKSEWYRWKGGYPSFMSSCAFAQVLIRSVGFRGLSVWALGSWASWHLYSKNQASFFWPSHTYEEIQYICMTPLDRIAPLFLCPS